ncbi:peroxiredoxin [Acinetobacter qingfengensis]|uniref:thioredoxin-dependent peroxiredoxin n=1 Tax=Acinetobacter qingfengensis TaxID=1262585 RepID=A0A1E7RDD0_9GAMM|nr:peroxiredoxin [Acinetobacter qingfengensis]KAA8735291.1 peroxiredoxin [Acinetobacter qingfengensis]OEY97410.1 peroxiredoxin [Acinetobacter qingfengensis]
MSDENINLPDLLLESSQGQINLAKLNHEWLVLYFYPKDSTPGCTTQANEFSQYQAQFTQLKTQIVGVSRDSLKSHERFIEKQNLNFTLISDPNEQLCQHFAVIKEKNMYGKKVMGIERSTFIFHQGKLLKTFRKVKAAGHAELILKEIQQLQHA